MTLWIDEQGNGFHVVGKLSYSDAEVLATFQSKEQAEIFIKLCYLRVKAMGSGFLAP
jgi:hypothetical protein